MTAEEVAETSRLHTQKQLAKLKSHLQKNPHALLSVSDKLREGGKTTEVHLINRFAEGTYPGVPYTVPAEQEGGMRRGTMVAYFLIGLLLVVLATVFIGGRGS